MAGRVSGFIQAPCNRFMSWSGNYYLVIQLNLFDLNLKRSEKVGGPILQAVKTSIDRQRRLYSQKNAISQTPYYEKADPIFHYYPIYFLMKMHLNSILIHILTMMTIPKLKFTSISQLERRYYFTSGNVPAHPPHRVRKATILCKIKIIKKKTDQILWYFLS